MKNFKTLINSVLGRPGIGLKGTGADKLQGDMEYKLLRCLKFYAFLAMQEMGNIETEEDKIAFALEKMKACRLHAIGNHDFCTHENARCHDHEYFLLRDRAAFGAKQRDLIVKHLFTEKVETVAWVKKHIIKPGNTSTNENYHSLVVNRGIVNKDAKICVEMNTIDAKYALATYFYNTGAESTFKSLFNHDENLNWKISNHGLEKIAYYEQTRRTDAVAMRKKKKKEEAKRAAQKMWQCNPLHDCEPGTYLTPKQKRKKASLSDPISNCPLKKNK